MKVLRALLLILLTVYLPLPNSHASFAGDSAVTRPVLSLTRANAGEHVIATVGQIIQVDLESLAGAGYGTPQVSSPHVEYRNSVRAMPPNPGGVLPVFIFEAVSVGDAEIRVARGDLPGFAVTVEVKPSAVTGEAATRLDQPGERGGADFHSVPAETGKSRSSAGRSESRLCGGRRYRDSSRLYGATHGRGGKNLVHGTHRMGVFCLRQRRTRRHARRGLRHRGQGTTRFGWKYAAKGYGRGEALFNGKPLLKGAHSSFLFKTFGSK